MNMDKSPEIAPAAQSPCAGCHEEFSTSAMKDVGNHLFCGACFQNLMTPQAAPQPSPSLSGVLEVEKAPAKDGCLLCGLAMPDGPAVRIGALGLCGSCHQGLTLQPVEAQASTSSFTPPEPAEPEESQPSYTPGSAHTTCTGCRRSMPGPGSYKEIAGGLYCPECFYSGKAPSAETEDSAQSSEPDSLATHESRDGSCESCTRVPASSSLTPVEGFLICEACLSTEPKLALAIARARHTKRLEDIAQDLIT